MYLLYFNESARTLKLKKAPKHLLDFPYEKEVKKYNENLYICLERKTLKEFAEEMKQQWIEELEQQLEELKNSKI